MGKLNISGCPRCKKGEVFIDRDFYGWYECCLQCGYTRDLPDIAKPLEGGQGSEKEKVLARRARSLTINKGVRPRAGREG
jgi:hypothetical protein